jgi:hypothetical protein
MKLKLDESLSHRLQAALGELGHDVSTASEEGLIGKPDSEVASAAAREHRMLFALDLGFADIRTYPPSSHPGIVVFRPPSPSLAAIIRFVTDLASRSDLSSLTGCVVVAEPGRTRVRWPDSGK